MNEQARLSQLGAALRQYSYDIQNSGSLGPFSGLLTKDEVTVKIGIDANGFLTAKPARTVKVTKAEPVIVEPEIIATEEPLKVEDATPEIPEEEKEEEEAVEKPEAVKPSRRRKT